MVQWTAWFCGLYGGLMVNDFTHAGSPSSIPSVGRKRNSSLP